MNRPRASDFRMLTCIVDRRSHAGRARSEARRRHPGDHHPDPHQSRHLGGRADARGRQPRHHRRARERVQDAARGPRGRTDRHSQDRSGRQRCSRPYSRRSSLRLPSAASRWQGGRANIADVAQRAQRARRSFRGSACRAEGAHAGPCVQHPSPARAGAQQGPCRRLQRSCSGDARFCRRVGGQSIPLGHHRRPPRIMAPGAGRRCQGRTRREPACHLSVDPGPGRPQPGHDAPPGRGKGGQAGQAGRRLRRLCRLLPVDPGGLFRICGALGPPACLALRGSGLGGRRLGVDGDGRDGQEHPEGRDGAARRAVAQEHRERRSAGR